jgi:hypothetical protein
VAWALVIPPPRATARRERLHELAGVRRQRPRPGAGRGRRDGHRPPGQPRYGQRQPVPGLPARHWSCPPKASGGRSTPARGESRRSAAARAWCSPPVARVRRPGRPGGYPAVPAGTMNAGHAARAGRDARPDRTRSSPAQTTTSWRSPCGCPRASLSPGSGATCRHSPDQRLARHLGPGRPRRTPGTTGPRMTSR